MSYLDFTPPVREIMWVLDHVAELGDLLSLPGFAALDRDLTEAIVREGGRFAAEVFAPLNRIGDIEGVRWTPDSVTLPDGFFAAYEKYCAGGWSALGAPIEHGGQDLPFVVSCAIHEQLTSANMAFALCMMLNQGAIAALNAHGSDIQKALYLPKLISGEWTGTMNLTEPQAGSDVGAVRSSAQPACDGSYRIDGTKIFISWGEHDLTENIVHLVLARLPDAPVGTKGLSMFLVPKYLPDADGGPGDRNDVHCLSIEHKLGIHASPTCTMRFGEQGKCVGWLVGREHGGMAAMFTMMNHARISVGIQGVAMAERACQAAVAFAAERIQGRLVEDGNGPTAIIDHPDVRRMLMTMRALTQAARALTYYTATAVDRAHSATDPSDRQVAQDIADFLTPIAKAWSTTVGIEVADLCVQVFGGTGYVEETGVAQFLRDVRIASIYEGTNGIQALDLVTRKLKGGRAASKFLFGVMNDTVEALAKDAELNSMSAPLADAVAALAAATQAVHSMGPKDAATAAVPYLEAFGICLAGCLSARQALTGSYASISRQDDIDFRQAKAALAAFFMAHLLPRTLALLEPVKQEAGVTFALSHEQITW